MLVLGVCIFQKYTHSPAKNEKKKTNMSNDCVFHYLLINTYTYNKKHLSGLPMPKFEANVNCIPPSPPSSMKQCNKSATVKISYGTTSDNYDPEAISQWCDTIIRSSVMLVW